MSKRRPQQIIWLSSADSTNNELRRRIAGLENLDIIAAEEQTAGRGQADHIWISAPGENLTFSILLKFEQWPDVRELQKINDCVCGAIISLLQQENISGAWIKQPNDIWVDGKKIAGILIENILEGRNIRESIVGVGLNINQYEWPEWLPNPVSLSELTGQEYDCRELLDRLSVLLAEQYESVFNKNAIFAQ